MMAKEVDFPAVWLAGFAALGGILGRFWPVVTPVNQGLGPILVIVALVLLAASAGQMFLARTTLIPRRDPAALVTTGLFRISRHPIYLGFAVLLLGLYISWDALIAIPLVAVFMAVMVRRFIDEEERRLTEIFGEDYAEYAARTRRWL